MPERMTISTIDPQEYEGKIVVCTCKAPISAEGRKRLKDYLMEVFGNAAKKIMITTDEIEITFAEDKGELEV